MNGAIKTKKIKVWCVLDIDGKIKHPSVSVFDSLVDANYEARKLNSMPNPTCNPKAKNKVVRGTLEYKYFKI